MSLLVTPSYEKLNDVRPLIDRLFMFSQPGASRFLVSMTPGSSLSMPAKSRPLSAMSSMFSRVISPERAPFDGLNLHGFGLDGHGFLRGRRPRAQSCAMPSRSVDPSSMPFCS